MEDEVFQCVLKNVGFFPASPPGQKAYLKSTNCLQIAFCQ
uniref:Uncharacterized protein n=1 Tax=Anguilla anguilla TaxID=7936 RepID=A0A0E9VJ49_ANGAN